MIRAIVLPLILIGSALTQTPATASGPSETMLAGIDITHNSIADIEKMYGKPNLVSNSGGWTAFQWQRLLLTLTVTTKYDPKHPANPDGSIISITIQGEGEHESKPISRTGRGLRLGAKASDVEKIYGVRATTGEVNITWSDATLLSVRVNQKGRIDQIQLNH